MWGLRKEIIQEVQRKADTGKQKIDAAIVSRVAAMTLDIVAEIIGRKKECKK